MDKKMENLVRDTEEVIALDELKLLLQGNKNPKSYWGVAPTGPPHLGYYRTISKQIDLVNAGFQHKILIADLHAYLDDRKCPWEELELRGKVYEICFRMLGLQSVEFVWGSTFQFSTSYLNKLYQIMALIPNSRATRAASTICRMDNPKVSQMVYPLMQNIDFLELDADVAYGGTDQRHVYMLGREYLPMLGGKKPILIFTPLGLSLTGKEKMSASNSLHRIELFASSDRIHSMIMSSFCPPKITQGNPIIEYIKYLIIPRINKFIINREKKYGGDLEIIKFAELEEQYKLGNIHPQDLKRSTAKYLVEILEPIGKYFQRHSDMINTFRMELL